MPKLSVALPATLLGAAAIQALEGVAVLVLGLYIGVEAVIGKPHDMGSAIGLAVFLLAAGAAMVHVGRGLFRALAWARSPAVLTQLFGLVVGYYMIQSRQQGYGIPMIVIAVIALAALLAPATARALYPDDDSDPTNP